MTAYFLLMLTVLVVIGYYDWHDLRQQGGALQWTVYGGLLVVGFALSGYFTLHVLAPDVMLPIQRGLTPLNRWILG